MTIQPLVPTSLPWVYDLIVGQEWPQGDEDALRRCAQAWTEALGALVGIAEGGDSAAQVVGYSVQSVSSDEFDKYWSRYTKGDDSVVGQMAQQCRQLAEIVLQDAEQVEFTKLSINIQVVILAIQLTIDIATAIVTAGASMAEGAAAATAARFTVKKLLMELLKGALMAAAPDFITQTIMLAEGHRSSYDINETLQAAGQGALGAGIGMAVGGVTGKLASSLTGGLGEDAGKSLGGKLLTQALNTGNAAVTGALTNMVTTGVTDVATGQSLDNVGSAGANGAANGLLFHGAHTAGEALGESMRPEPTHFTLDNGAELHGLALKDGSFALFDQRGMKHGTGWYDPQSGQLSVRPVSGEPYRVGASAGEPQPAHNEPGPPREQSDPTHSEPEPLNVQSDPTHSEPAPVDTPHQGPDLSPEPVHRDPAPDPLTGAPAPEPPRGMPGPAPEPPRAVPEPAPHDPYPPSHDPTPEPSRTAPGPTPEPPHGGSGPISEPPPDRPERIAGSDPTSIPGEPNSPDADPSLTGGASLASADPIDSASMAPAASLAEQHRSEASVESNAAPAPDLIAAPGQAASREIPTVGARSEAPDRQAPTTRRLAGGKPASTGNRILEELNAASAPTRPEQHPDTFSALGGPTRDLTPKMPEVGEWTANDQDWHNRWNYPTSEQDRSEKVMDQWVNGAAAPNARTRQEMVNDENSYLEGMQDPQRRVFHELAAEVLEERHDAVKPVLDDVLQKLRAGELRGLDYHRKFAESLDRKFGEIEGLAYDGFPADLTNLRPEERAALVEAAREKLNGLSLDVNDPLRYTMVFDEGDYARGAQETLKALHEAGYRLLENVGLPGGTEVPGARPLLESGMLPADASFAKNFWREGNRYLGMNLTLVDEHGGPFELQFHTPRSFDLKQQLSHEAYEVFRADGTPPERRVNAMLELVGMSDKYLKNHVPRHLEDFAPQAIDNGLGKFFDKLGKQHAGDANLAAAVDLQNQEIRAVNLKLAERLNSVAEGGLGDEAAHNALNDIAGLVQTREQLMADPTQSQHQPSPEPGDHDSTARPEPGEHTSLGDQAVLAPGHHSTLHLEHPIQLSEDHLVFPFRDEGGQLAWAHLQNVDDRWVLHAGGAEGENLKAIGENLRTTPPGLDLIGHATPDGFLIGGKTVPFEEVLSHIPHAADGEGPIRLIACAAGGGDGAAAQRLADLSGRKVIAADATVWVEPDGHVVASNPVDQATNWYPKRPADGVWKEYEPGTRLASSEDAGGEVGDWEHAAPKTLDADDARLPRAPEGWESEPGGARHEFHDLGFDYRRPGYAGQDPRSAAARDAVRDAQKKRSTAMNRGYRGSLGREFEKEFGIKRPQAVVERAHLEFEQKFKKDFEIRREIELRLLDKGAPPFAEFDVDKPGYKPDSDHRTDLERERVRQTQRAFQQELLAGREQRLDDAFLKKFKVPRPKNPTRPEHIDFVHEQTVVEQVRDAATVRSLDLSAPAQVGFDFNHYPEGDISIQALLLAKDLDGEFAKNFRKPAADFVNDKSAFTPDQLLHPGQANGDTNPRIVMGWQSEIHRVANHPLGHGVEEHGSFAGIPLVDHGMGHGKRAPNPGQQITSFAGSSPESGHMGDGYVAIENEYKKFVDRATQGTGRSPEEVDQEFGSALQTLLRETDPVKQRAGLEELASDVYGTASPIYGTSGWKDTPSGRLLMLGARTAHLVGHIEIGRNPDAITNLMALHMAAEGRLPMDDVFAYGNIMSPSGAAILGRLDKALSPGLEVPDIREKILPMARSEYRNFDAVLAAENLDAFRSRRLQVVAEFAYSQMERLPDDDPIRKAFQADPAGWLAANPGFLLDQLVKAF